MLTLTYTRDGGDVERVVLGDGANGFALKRVQIPRSRRVKITPTRGGAAVQPGAMDVKPITVTGSIAAWAIDAQKTPPRLDVLQTLERWMTANRRVSVTYPRTLWTTPRTYTILTEDLGFHRVTELDPTYLGFRLGIATQVDWRLVLTPEATIGRAV